MNEQPTVTIQHPSGLAITIPIREYIDELEMEIKRRMEGTEEEKTEKLIQFRNEFVFDKAQQILEGR